MDLLRAWNMEVWQETNKFDKNTESFRKNGKSKTVFMGTKFHEELIFSAFFGRKLATNLHSWATRSVSDNYCTIYSILIKEV